MSAAEEALQRLRDAIAGAHRSPGVTLMDDALDADVALVRDALTKAERPGIAVADVPTEPGLYADKDGDQWRLDADGWTGLSGASSGMTAWPPARRWGPFLRLNEPEVQHTEAEREEAAAGLDEVVATLTEYPDESEVTPTDRVVYAFHSVEEALRSLPAEQTGEATLLLPLPDGRTLFRHVLLHPQSWTDSRGMR